MKLMGHDFVIIVLGAFQFQGTLPHLFEACPCSKPKKWVWLNLNIIVALMVGEWSCGMWPLKGVHSAEAASVWTFLLCDCGALPKPNLLLMKDWKVKKESSHTHPMAVRSLGTERYAQHEKMQPLVITVLWLEMCVFYSFQRSFLVFNDVF